MMGFITRMQIAKKMREEKAKFRQQEKYVMQRTKLEEQNEKLRLEKHRQVELEKLRAEQARLTPPQKPSKLKKFGQGVAKVMNKTKTGMANAKKQGFLKGAQFGAPPSTGSRGLDTVGGGSPFGAQKNLDVGGSGLQFGKAETPKPKDKRTTIIIKQ